MENELSCFLFLLLLLSSFSKASKESKGDEDMLYTNKKHSSIKHLDGVACDGQVTSKTLLQCIKSAYNPIKSDLPDSFNSDSANLISFTKIVLSNAKDDLLDKNHYLVLHFPAHVVEFFQKLKTVHDETLSKDSYKKFTTSTAKQHFMLQQFVLSEQNPLTVAFLESCVQSLKATKMSMDPNLFNQLTSALIQMKKAFLKLSSIKGELIRDIEEIDSGPLNPKKTPCHSTSTLGIKKNINQYNTAGSLIMMLGSDDTGRYVASSPRTKVLLGDTVTVDKDTNNGIKKSSTYKPKHILTAGQDNPEDKTTSKATKSTRSQKKTKVTFLSPGSSGSNSISENDQDTRVDNKVGVNDNDTDIDADAMEEDVSGDDGSILDIGNVSGNRSKRVRKVQKRNFSKGTKIVVISIVVIAMLFFLVTCVAFYFKRIRQSRQKAKNQAIVTESVSQVVIT